VATTREARDRAEGHVQGEIDVRGLVWRPRLEAQAGASFVGGKADGGEDVRWLDGARGQAAPVEQARLSSRRDEESFAFDAGKDKVVVFGVRGAEPPFTRD